MNASTEKWLTTPRTTTTTLLYLTGQEAQIVEHALHNLQRHYAAPIMTNTISDPLREIHLRLIKEIQTIRRQLKP